MIYNFQERQMALDLGFEEQAYQLIKSTISLPLFPLTLRQKIEKAIFDPATFTGRVEPTANDRLINITLDLLGCVILSADAPQVIDQLQVSLLPLGYQVVALASDGDKDFGEILQIGLLQAAEKFGTKTMLGFLKAEHCYSLMWARQTNGMSYDMRTKDIIDKLREWEKLSTFNVLGVGSEWISIRFQALPTDLEAFAEDLYDFCPDVLDQSLVKMLPDELADYEEAEMLDFIEDELDEQDIKELANYIATERKLFLWWD